MGELLARAQDIEDEDVHRGLRLVGIAHSQHVALSKGTYDASASVLTPPEVCIQDYVAVDHLCV